MLLLWTMLTLVPAICGAQEGRRHEYLLKSAFIERFTRFVQWPFPFRQSGSDPVFVIGALCDPTFCEVLEAVFANRRIKELPVRFRLVKTPAQLSGCNLVYIGKTDDATLKGFLSRLRSQPVLMVSDTRGYAGKGVHINMFVEGGQIRFEINLKSAVASGLKISHLLLQLARIVDTEDGGES